MIALLRQRNFGLLWFGGLVSFIGDWVLFVSLPLYVLDLTKSVVAMGVIFMVNIVPMLIFSSIGGVFVDRWDRKQILVVTNLLLVPLYSLFLFFDDASKVWIVYLVGFAGNIIRQLLNPAENALLPKLVGSEDLVQANTLNSLNNNLARLLGPAIGGVIFATMGFRFAVIIDVITFLVAAILISLISAPSSVTRADPHPVAEGEVPPKRNVRREFMEGLQIIRKSRTLTALIAIIGVNNVVDGIVTVLLAVYAERALGGGSPELGALMTAQAIGGLVGGVFIGRIAKRFLPWQLVGFGFIVLGIADFAIFGFPILPLNLALILLVGVPIVGLEVGAMTLFQTLTEDRFRGRVFGIYGTIAGILLLIGRGIATLLGDTIDVGMLMAGVSLLYIPAGIASFLLLRGNKPVGVTEITEAAEPPLDEAVPVGA